MFMSHPRVTYPLLISINLFIKRNMMELIRKNQISRKD